MNFFRHQFGVRSSTRRPVVAGILMSTALALGIGVAGVPEPAVAATAGVIQRSTVDVTADGLPTVQIDGVVWSQVIIGNTVYAGGQFTSARPAGAAAGTDETPRSNLLAYNLTTGELITTFAPTVNGSILTVSKSSTGKTLYIGGSFTSVNGKKRYRVAALNPTTGAVTSFAPKVNGTVRVVMASKSRVYVGGHFTKVGSKKRAKAAAFSTSTRKLLSWAPKADSYVRALTLTPDKKSVVIGGAFTKIGTSKVYGMARVDAKSAKLRTWKINKTIRDYGSKAGITSLTADKSYVYGSGYSYGEGNFEGAFKANPKTGAIVWLQDCRGDTYDIALTKDRLYSVGHAHNCSNIGGFGEIKPLAARTLAVTLSTKGTVAANPIKQYNVFTGRPTPALVNWFPELAVGNVTGQSQAAWSIEAAHGYVVLGGEFPAVNGRPQQGLVRFSVPANAPRKQGPLSDGIHSMATVVAGAEPGTANVSWRSNNDRDDQDLNYQILRDGVVVHTTTARSQFWNRPTLSFVDTGLSAGTKYRYVVVASDSDGNTATSANVSFTTPSA